MPFRPGSGGVDDEPTLHPHGDLIDSASGLAINVGGTDLPGIGFFQTVAAYRSLVVAVHVTGAFPVTVTPRWNFDKSVATLPIDGVPQTVAAGATKRLLFQNLGDLLTRIRVAGVGGASTITYYVTGSNLDPLPGSTGAFLYLVGVAAGTQVTVSGVGFNVQFQQAGGVSYNSDPTVYEFNTVVPGVTDTVDVLQEGLYMVAGGFVYQGPAGTYPWQAGLVGHNIDPVAPLMAPNLSGSDPGNVYYAGADLFRVGPASLGAGNNSIQLSGVQTSGVNISLASAYLHIARLASVAP